MGNEKMACYRVVIPYGVPHPDQTGRLRRFAAELECQNATEARKRGVAVFHELRVAVGLRLTTQPTEADVFIDEVQIRAENPLQIAALEFVVGVFCMKIEGPLDSQTALRLDREVYRLQQQGCRSLALDLSLVHPIGSAGLGVLLNFNDRLHLQLIQVPVNALNMMQMLGLEASMKIYRTFSEALSTAPQK